MSLESGLFSAQRPFVRGGLSCAPAACLPACLLLLPPPGSWLCRRPPGKWKADFKFGHWAISWGNSAVFSAHCLAREIERLPRRSKSGRRVKKEHRDRGVLVDSNKGSVYRHHFLARYIKIGGLARLAREYDNVLPPRILIESPWID
jgi:hypothetical protein